MLMRNQTILVLVDVQEKLLPVMYQEEKLLKNLEILVEGAITLDIPIIWLEQYPKGLGPTVPTLKNLLVDAALSPLEKMTFSGVPHPQFQAMLDQYPEAHFVVAGIETHVCVYQTVRDLLMLDREVEVVSDAVSSRVEPNIELGLNKMIQLGANLTSVEMVLFELLESAEDAQFKAISRLIR
ncbi:isochorismatase family protein [Ignatzschineria indica]|uniref:isochorismatase family protein n=1 Tax=Ignatzschineria indica TaxID=472583 RepID=UPI0025755568|nr:isochorismatase family protein [Ignatzschineria indica]MDM1544726.1 isochorismatase family protein [Ignatzschineria indica]